MHLLPGDPAVIIAGDRPAPSNRGSAPCVGLHKPVAEQLWLWMVHLFQGNFGDSLILHQPVLEAVVERLPVTLSLAAVGVRYYRPDSIGLGMFAAYWRDSWFDSAVMGFALLGSRSQLLDRDVVRHSVQREILAGCRRRAMSRFGRSSGSGLLRWFSRLWCWLCFRSAIWPA